MKHNTTERNKIVKMIKLFLLFYILTNALSVLVVNHSFAEIITLDRRIDWSPGVLGGIPTYAVDKNVKTDCGAKGDGITDDTNAIQNCINSSASGKAVYLPEGTYKITNTLSIFQKTLVLRGDGPESTRIMNYASGGAEAIRIYNWSGSATTDITAGYTKDSSFITVVNADNFNVGDYVRVTQDNDSSIVDLTGCIGTCSWCSSVEKPAMGQIVKITNKAGNVFTINRPLYFTFNLAQRPRIYKAFLSNDAYRSGVEDLYIERIGGSGDYNIIISNCIECWIKNVESYNANAGHARIVDCYACEIRDSYFHHAHVYSSGSAYGVFLFGKNSDVLVENNIFYYLRHSMILEGGGSGNVFGYNYSHRMFDDSYPDTDWLMSDISTHGAHPYMNLFEGNIAAHIDADNYWGSASHNTYFRNHIERYSKGENKEIKMALRAVEIQENNYYMNVVGNVLCTNGCSGSVEPATIGGFDPTIWTLGYHCGNSTGAPTDYKVSSTLLRHGNWDYISQSTQWDTNITDHTLPNSYYLKSKPAFFRDLSWPAIGPDVSGLVSNIPAKMRFYAPRPPKKLR